jgi:hypothetical protein
MTKKDVYPDSRNISVDKAKAMFQKAIDLRLMERKDIPRKDEYRHYLYNKKVRKNKENY